MQCPHTCEPAGTRTCLTQVGGALRGSSGQPAARLQLPREMAEDEQAQQARMKAEAADHVVPFEALTKAGWLEVYRTAPGVTAEWEYRWAQLSVDSFVLYDQTEGGAFPARGKGARPSCVVDMARCVDIRNVPDTDEVADSSGLEIHLDVATEPPVTWRVKVAWSDDAADAPLGLKLSVRHAWREALAVACEEAQSWFKKGDAVIVKQPGRGGQYVPAVAHKFNGDGTCSVRYALDRAEEVDRTGEVSEEEGALDQQGTAAEDVGTIVVDCMCVRPNDLRQLLKATPSEQLADLLADFFESAGGGGGGGGGGGRDSPQSPRASGLSSTELVERRLVKFFAPFATEPVPCPAQEAREMRLAAQQHGGGGSGGGGFFATLAPAPAASTASSAAAAGVTGDAAAIGSSALALMGGGMGGIAPPPIGAAASELSRQLSETASASFAGLTSRFSMRTVGMSSSGSAGAGAGGGQQQ